MSQSMCPRCEEPVFHAERLQSMGKDWHRACLKCDSCDKLLNPAGHAEHDGRPFCHIPCYAALFGSGFAADPSRAGGGSREEQYD